MIKNARIVSIDTNPLTYHTQKVEDRGKLNYAISSSDLRLFAGCPSKWKHGFEVAPSASLEYGNLFDTLVLTPGDFNKRFILQPTTYFTSALKCPSCGSITDSSTCRKCKVERVPVDIENPWSNKSDTCREWVEQQKAAGLEVVSQDELKEAQDAKARLLADEQCRLFIENCDKQVLVTAEWHDEATGLVIPIRCLIDLASKPDGLFPKSLGDLKTTKSAAITAWAKWAHFAGYDIQAAWNTDLFVAATKREITDFCFVLSENTFPWEIGRRYMSQDILEPAMDTGDIASGRRQYKRIMADYCQCVKRNVWPGYDATDESSSTGWTLVTPNPYDEQRRMFAPRYNFEEPEPENEGIPEDPNGDVTP